MRSGRAVVGAGVVVCFLLGACQHAASSSSCDEGVGMQAAMERPLWDRLGGEPAVTAVVDDFVGRAAGDPRVNFFRRGVSGATEWTPDASEVAMLKRHLVTFISMASGGPLAYEGRSMKAAHAGMRIRQAEFDALAADLKASLDHFKVPAREQSELLAAVAGTAGDIVEIR